MATLLKNILSFYEKNLHGRILKKELKEQHLHTVLKFYPYIYIGKFQNFGGPYMAPPVHIQPGY